MGKLILKLCKSLLENIFSDKFVRRNFEGK